MHTMCRGAILIFFTPTQQVPFFLAWRVGKTEAGMQGSGTNGDALHPRCVWLPSCICGFICPFFSPRLCSLFSIDQSRTKENTAVYLGSFTIFQESISTSFLPTVSRSPPVPEQTQILPRRSIFPVTCPPHHVALHITWQTNKDLVSQPNPSQNPPKMSAAGYATASSYMPHCNKYTIQWEGGLLIAHMQ